MSWLGSGEENDNGRRGKVVSVYNIRANGGRTGPLILNLGASWRWTSRCGRFIPKKKGIFLEKEAWCAPEPVWTIC
jgi:hypothetical protein